MSVLLDGVLGVHAVGVAPVHPLIPSDACLFHLSTQDAFGWRPSHTSIEACLRRRGTTEGRGARFERIECAALVGQGLPTFS